MKKRNKKGTKEKNTEKTNKKRAKTGKNEKQNMKQKFKRLTEVKKSLKSKIWKNSTELTTTYDNLSQVRVPNLS